MKVNDILGFGKVLPIDKLIEIVSKVTGRLSKPYFDKKDIETKAYEIKRLAEAKAEEIKIISLAIKQNYLLTEGIEYKENNISITSPKGLPKGVTQVLITTPSLEERTKDRIDFRDIKKQFNIESVTAFAAEELKNEKAINDEPLDEDWATRFFSITEDVSNEEMQALWGRILAREIKHPKSYSLRTLEMLKNLSKEEAEIFTKFANLKVVSDGITFICNHNSETFLENEFGITFEDKLLLKELGFWLRG